MVGGLWGRVRARQQQQQQQQWCEGPLFCWLLGDGWLWVCMGIFLATLGATRGVRTNIVAEVPTLDIGPVVVVRVAVGSTARLPCRHPHYPDDTLNLVLWYLNHSTRPFLSYDARSTNKKMDNSNYNNNSMNNNDNKNSSSGNRSISSMRSETLLNTSNNKNVKNYKINSLRKNSNYGNTSKTIVNKDDQIIPFAARRYNKRITRSVLGGTKKTRKSRRKLNSGGTSLVIKDVRETDQAEYRCRVHFRLSPTWTQRLKLVVEGEVSSVTLEDGAGLPLESRVGPLAEGANLTLTCQASHGTSDVESLWWLLEGKELDTSWASAGEGVVVNQLAIVGLQERHRNANLTCRLVTTDMEDANVAANITERSITIAMFYVPEAILKGEGGHTLSGGGRELTEGQTLSFLCSVRADPPVYNLTWLHNGRMVGVGGRVWARDNSSLVISPVERQDAGLYACLASNSEGDGHSNAIPVVVTHRPYCSGSPHQKLVVAANTSISLTCQVDAQPQDITFTWKIGASPTPSHSHSQSIVNHRLNQGQNQGHFPDLVSNQPFSRNFDMGSISGSSSQTSTRHYDDLTSNHISPRHFGDLTSKQSNLQFSNDIPNQFGGSQALTPSLTSFDDLTSNNIDPAPVKSRVGHQASGGVTWEVPPWPRSMEDHPERDDRSEVDHQHDPLTPDTSTVTLTPSTSTVVGCYARNSVGHIKVPCTYTLTVVEPPKALQDCNITLVGVTRMEVRCEDPAHAQDSAHALDPALQDAQHSPSMSFVRSPAASTKANLEVWSGDTLVANVSEGRPIFTVRGLPPDAQLRLVLYTATPHSRSTPLYMYTQTRPRKHVHLTVPPVPTSPPERPRPEPDLDTRGLLEKVDWRLGGIVGGVGVMVVALVVGVVMWVWERRASPPEHARAPAHQLQHYHGITLDTLASEGSVSEVTSVMGGSTSPVTTVTQSRLQVKVCGEENEGMPTCDI